MTRSLTIAALLLFTVACNSNKTEPAAEPTTVSPTTEPPVSSPAPPHEYAVKATYSSAFEIGDHKLGDIIVELWKQYDENTLDKGLDYFADTVTMWMADGWRFHGTRDSLMKLTKKSRADYSSMKAVVVAIVPLKSTDKNENWVSIYGTEYSTMKNKKDSSDIQENWMFDKNGKVAMMHSYRRKIK